MTRVENFSVLYNGIIRYLLLNVGRTYRAISSRRRRTAIMATPLKMDFIKAIFPSDRCRRKRRKPEPKGMRPLPLADPLRMIITSRRLNFALLLPYPSLPVPILVAPEGSTPQRTASLTSSPPPLLPTYPIALHCRPYIAPSLAPRLF